MNRESSRRVLVVTCGLLLVIALVAGLASYAFAVPGIPHRFLGGVTINAGPAVAGLTVTAQIDGVEYISVLTDSQGRYGWDPVFNVPADDPDTPEKEGGSVGETVELFVNGVLSGNAFFENGAITQLDLDGALAEYVLKVTSTDGGNVTEPGEGNFTYYQGIVVDLLAVPGDGFRFLNWTGSVTTVDDVNAADTFITMDGNYTVQANFEALQTDLVVSSTDGGNVTEPGEGEFTYDQGIVVDLLAVPDPGFAFVNWTNDVGTIDDVNAADTFINMDGNYTIQANFEALQTQLIIASTDGGNVTEPGEGNFTYFQGTVVDLLAVPDEGFAFVNWTGNVTTVGDVNAADTFITMDGNYTIQANFEALQTELIVASTGGGNVTEPGEGNFTYFHGTVVDLLAAADPGFAFVNWTNDVGTIDDVNAADTFITMDGNYTIQANFEESPLYDLTVTSSGGGSVTEPGEGNFTYFQGTVVDLLAVPDEGFAFINWTGNVTTVDDVNAADTFITMNDNYTVQANFEEGTGPTPTPTPSPTPAPEIPPEGGPPGNGHVPGEGNLTFDRRLFGNRVGQHKAPPNAQIIMEISVSIKIELVGATLVDHFPSSWVVHDALGGTVSLPGNETSKIEWYLGNVTAGSTIVREYVLRSPGLTTPPTKYQFWSELTYPGGSVTSDLWDVIVADPLPNAPSDTHAKGLTSTSMAVAWVPSSTTDINGYKIYRSANDVSYSLLDTLSGGQLVSSYVDTGLPASTTYYYQISSWRQPSAVIEFAVADDGGSTTDETTAAQNSTTDDMTLLPATPAVNDAYYFGASATFGTVTLDVSTAGVGTWTIIWEYDNGSWTALSGVTDGTSGFTVAGENDISYTIPGDWVRDRVAGTRAYWIRGRVSSYTSVTTQPLGAQAWTVAAEEESSQTSTTSYSSASTTAPDPPRGLRATGGNGNISLTWNSNSESNLSGYNVYRATASNGSFSKINASLVTGNSTVDSSFSGGNASDFYFYYVTAVDSTPAEGSMSGEVWARPDYNPDSGGPHVAYTIATSACAACHRTHAGLSPKLLAAGTERALCFTCHDGSGSDYNISQEFTSPTSEHPVPDDTLKCSDCHNAHINWETYPKLISAEGQHSGNAVCYTCHGASDSNPPATDYQTPFESGFHESYISQSPSGTEIQCASCHKPHASAFRSLEIQKDENLCFSCHDGSTVDSTVGGDVLSSFIASSETEAHHDVSDADQTAEGTITECVNCHNPHTTSSSSKVVDPEDPSPAYSSRWTGTTRAFCETCHDSAYPTSLQTEPFAPAPQGPTPALTDIQDEFLNNDQMGNQTTSQAQLDPAMGYVNGEAALPCETCHDPHGSTNPYHLRTEVFSKDGTFSKEGLLVIKVPSGGYDWRFFCNACHDESQMGNSKSLPTDCSSGNCHFHGGAF